jgi:hypothetical protein
MRPPGPQTLAAALLAVLLGASSALAQTHWRWFTPKAPDKAVDKTVDKKSPLPDPRRVTEINVELAWLADPITFPYYLEAHVTTAQQLEVRGYVPNRAVRDYALRIAQVYSSLPVVDSMKEHASLLVRPSLMSQQQLQSSVQSSLKVALPKLHQQLKVECGGDGKVSVFGPVTSHEDKITISHALRRLHGCTSVQNMTTLPPELSPPPPPNLADTRPRLGPPGTVAKEQGPDLGIKGPEVINVQAPMPPSRTISPEELQKRIVKECPRAISATATFTSSTEVRIVIETRSADDIGPIAERIFKMTELQNFRPDLQFSIK